MHVCRAVMAGKRVDASKVASACRAGERLLFGMGAQMALVVLTSVEYVAALIAGPLIRHCDGVVLTTWKQTVQKKTRCRLGRTKDSTRFRLCTRPRCSYTLDSAIPFPPSPQISAGINSGINPGITAGIQPRSAATIPVFDT